MDTQANGSPTAMDKDTQATDAPTAMDKDTQATDAPTAMDKDTQATDAPTAMDKDTQATDAPTAMDKDTQATDAPTEPEFDFDKLFESKGLQIEQKPEASLWAIKLEQWFIFTVIIALSPIVLNAFRIIAKADQHEPLNFDSLIASHGELALVCAAITAEAIGDMFVSGQTKGHRRLYAFGMCCIIFFFSSGIFVIAESVAENAQSNLAFLANASLAMLVCTLFAGGGCKYFTAIAEEQKNA